MAGGPLQIEGPLLIDSGFPIVAIYKGAKAPIGDGWESKPLKKEDLTKYNGSGVGLLAGVGERPLCLIDMDCAWEPGLQEAERLAFEILGFSPQRIGQAPKQTLFYIAESHGWAKRSTTKFIHESCPKRLTRNKLSEPLVEKDQFLQIEVLGKGQQSVIYGIHPVTGKPFEWVDMYGGLSFMSMDDLTVISGAKLDEYMDRWEAWMREQPGISEYAPAKKAPRYMAQCRLCSALRVRRLS
jgi:putative DNA primase/helicase